MAKTLKMGKVQDLPNGNGGSSFHTYSHTWAPFRKYQDSSSIYWTYQGAKKVSFTAYCSSKRQPTFTSPGVILISQEKSCEEQGEFQFFCNVNFLKKIVCPSGKLRTKFTSPIAKSTSPRLLDMTFFVHCILIIVIIILTDIILSLLTNKNSMHISSAKFKEWNF